MTTYAMKMHTGPNEPVRFYSTKLQEAGLRVTCEGTEHVYCEVTMVNTERDATDAALHIRYALTRKHGKDFGLRPQFVQVVR